MKEVWSSTDDCLVDESTIDLSIQSMRCFTSLLHKRRNGRLKIGVGRVFVRPSENYKKVIMIIKLGLIVRLDTVENHSLSKIQE